jgi:hypothetical protein
MFGLLVAGMMWAILRWHQYNRRVHHEELHRLHEIARNDNLHG